MKILVAVLVGVVLAGSARAIGPQRKPATAARPLTSSQERDRQVLETLLLYLLNDPRFAMTTVERSRAMIVLHRQTPETGTGMIQPDQLKHYLEGHRLPADIRNDLVRRNVKRGTFETHQASFDRLPFSPRIEVADLSGKMNSRTFAFSEAYPRARGWVEAFLPGYSKNGAQAVVRAWIGPSAHGALVTALLARQGGQWNVVWRALVFFG